MFFSNKFRTVLFYILLNYIHFYTHTLVINFSHHANTWCYQHITVYCILHNSIPYYVVLSCCVVLLYFTRVYVSLHLIMCTDVKATGLDADYVHLFSSFLCRAIIRSRSPRRFSGSALKTSSLWSVMKGENLGGVCEFLCLDTVEILMIHCLCLFVRGKMIPAELESSITAAKAKVGQQF